MNIMKIKIIFFVLNIMLIKFYLFSLFVYRKFKEYLVNVIVKSSKIRFYSVNISICRVNTKTLITKLNQPKIKRYALLDA